MNSVLSFFGLRLKFVTVGIGLNATGLMSEGLG